MVEGAGLRLIPPPALARAGYFGPYGGRFVPETVIPTLEELEAAFWEALADPSFLAEFERLLRTFQSVIGAEARAQALEAMGQLPEVAVACVGGGSNAIGLFAAFLEDPVELVGVEAGGEGIPGGRHAARFADPVRGRPGVLHGSHTMVLQDPWGQILETHSISAGLDYPAVGPEHAWLRDRGRVRYTAVTDAEALAAFQALARLEGILPALESAHAVAEAMRIARERPGVTILINLSGRGDKDVETVAKALGEALG